VFGHDRHDMSISPHEPRENKQIGIRNKAKFFVLHHQCAFEKPAKGMKKVKSVVSLDRSLGKTPMPQSIKEDIMRVSVPFALFPVGEIIFCPSRLLLFPCHLRLVAKRSRHFRFSPGPRK